MSDSKKAQAAASAVIAKVAKDSKQAPAASSSSNPAGVLKRTNQFFIDPTKIVRKEGHNPRFDFGDIERLAAQIKTQKAQDGHGLLNDIRVKRLAAGDGPIFELVDGDRRLTAIELLIKRGEVFEFGIPAKIDGKDQTEIDGLLKMFIANEGKAFLPLEEAMAYKKMQEAGMTIKEICAAVGRKHVHVIEIMGLLNADESVKEAVTDGSIGKTIAKQIAKVAKGDKAKQQELVKQAKAVGKDSTKRRAVLKEVEKTRAAKAAKKGKTLKIRALDDVALSEIGAKMAAALLTLLEPAGMKAKDDLRAWVAKDPELALAYTFGALEALKVAAGSTDNLVL